MPWYLTVRRGANGRAVHGGALGPKSSAGSQLTPPTVLRECSTALRWAPRLNAFCPMVAKSKTNLSPRSWPACACARAMAASRSHALDLVVMSPTNAPPAAFRARFFGVRRTANAGTARTTM